MKRICSAIILATLSTSLLSGVSFAQDHHHDHYVHHSEWRQGGHINRNDWNRGARIDYRHYHLHAPPRGYEWREVDGNYVLAAVATGVIASVVIATH